MIRVAPGDFLLACHQIPLYFKESTLYHRSSTFEPFEPASTGLLPSNASVSMSCVSRLPFRAEHHDQVVLPCDLLLHENQVVPVNLFGVCWAFLVISLSRSATPSVTLEPRRGVSEARVPGVSSETLRDRLCVGIAHAPSFLLLSSSSGMFARETLASAVESLERECQYTVMNCAARLPSLPQAFHKATVLLLTGLQQLLVVDEETEETQESRKDVQTLHAWLDVLRGPVVVVAVVDDESAALPTSLLRAGRLDVCVRIPRPTLGSRQAFLAPLLGDTLAAEAAPLGSGFTFADLRRFASQVKRSGGDVAAARCKVAATGMLETLAPQRVEWSQVVGCHKVKQALEQTVLWPLVNSRSLQRLVRQRPSGLLIYGPSGVGKTLCVHAFATAERRVNFIEASAPDLWSKYLGQSEEKIRRLFARARSLAPCVLFFDQLEALARKRGDADSEETGGVGERVVSTLLNEMDGVAAAEGDVIVVACSSRPWIIDPALMRPGRLDRKVYCALPSRGSRAALLPETHRHLAREEFTGHWSCAEVTQLARALSKMGASEALKSVVVQKKDTRRL